MALHYVRIPGAEQIEEELHKVIIVVPADFFKHIGEKVADQVEYLKPRLGLLAKKSPKMTILGPREPAAWQDIGRDVVIVQFHESFMQVFPRLQAWDSMLLMNAQVCRLVKASGESYYVKDRWGYWKEDAPPDGLY